MAVGQASKLVVRVGGLARWKHSKQMKRRPHWEREELLQMYLLGAFAAQPKLMEAIEPSQFSEPWASAVAFAQKALKGDTAAFDRWLSATLGVVRVNGDKAIDAALERLRQDAEFRAAAKEDEGLAWHARVSAAMRDKRERK